MTRRYLVPLVFASFAATGYAQFRTTQDWVSSGTQKGASGKFQVYEVQWRVVTPGGRCQWNASLSPDQGPEQSTIHLERHGRLEPGLSTLKFDFDANRIARYSATVPWEFQVDGVMCNGVAVPDQQTIFRAKTRPLEPADFEARTPQLTIEVEPIGEIAAGKKSSAEVRVNRLGEAAGKIELTVAGVPPELKATPMIADWADSWMVPGGVEVFVRDSARAGTYTLQLTAALGDLRASIPLTVSVLSGKGQLQVADLVSGPPRHVMLLIGRSGSSGQICGDLYQLPLSLSKGLREGTDSLGIITYGLSVNVLAPLSTNFRKAAAHVADQLKALKCAGPNNLVYALEKAQEMLSAIKSPGTKDMVVMLGGRTSMIAANWPVRRMADERYDRLRNLRMVPASDCREGVSTRGAAPIAGAPVLYQIETTGVASDPTVVPVNQAANCVFDGGGSWDRDVAYFPEMDVAGVSLSGRHKLERFGDGPYKGRIRPDTRANVDNAVWNLLENAVLRIRADQKNRIGIHALTIGYQAAMEEQQFLAEGHLEVIADGEQIAPAVKRVFAAINSRQIE